MAPSRLVPKATVGSESRREALGEDDVGGHDRDEGEDQATTRRGANGSESTHHDGTSHAAASPPNSTPYISRIGGTPNRRVTSTAASTASSTPPNTKALTSQVVPKYSAKPGDVLRLEQQEGHAEQEQVAVRHIERSCAPPTSDDGEHADQHDQPDDQRRRRPVSRTARRRPRRTGTGGRRSTATARSRVGCHWVTHTLVLPASARRRARPARWRSAPRRGTARDRTTGRACWPAGRPATAPGRSCTSRTRHPARDGHVRTAWPAR